MEGRERTIYPDRLLQRLALCSTQRDVLAPRQVHQVHLAAASLTRPLVLPRDRQPDQQVTPAAVLVQVRCPRRPDAHPQLEEADPLLQPLDHMLPQPLHLHVAVPVRTDPHILLLAPAREQVLDLLVVDLEHRHLDLQIDQHCPLLLRPEEVLQHAVSHSSVLPSSSSDGVALPAPGGPVRKHADVVAVDHRLQQSAGVIEELLLRAPRAVGCVEMKLLAPSLVQH
mmetsp:Transcript_18780/g.43156  ORF Transcript_18780/g.43156 Transcript_18780/m.43156 type:complete len:226 (+) Transcript_18780:1042-1719(+)